MTVDKNNSELNYKEVLEPNVDEMNIKSIKTDGFLDILFQIISESKIA